LTVRELVTNLERAVVALLADYDINAAGGALARAALRRAGQTPPMSEARFSPGVYAGEKKIAALGLRVSRGFCYHGVALNVRMDLRPFADINPCGFAGLAAAQMADFGVAQTAAQVSPQLAAKLIEIFNNDDGKPPPDALR
jgi:lipoyl(octanoyl) transferase